MTDGAQPPQAPRVTGIDVSAWQPRIDWTQVASAGHRFTYLKLTEGETYRSPTYEAQWSGAQDAGLAVGPYHFAEPDASALDDADRFVDAHKHGFHEGVLSPLLDLEVANSLDPARVVDWAWQWIERVEALTSREPVLYTGPNFWRYHLLGAGQRAFDLQSLPLMQAQYAPAPSAMLDAPTWRRWIWQWTGSGACPGIAGKVDLDRWLGSAEDWLVFTGGLPLA